jgi:alanine dehydrogenase
MGVAAAVKSDPALAKGVNVYDGHITYKGVADAFGLAYTDLSGLL